MTAAQAIRYGQSDKADYGILPPPGDQVNGTFGFASKKLAHLVGVMEG